MFKETKMTTISDKIVIKNIDELIDNVTAIIPPLWPLNHFVAVNPFLGELDNTFLNTSKHFQEVSHQDIIISVRFFQDAYQKGDLTEKSIQEAILSLKDEGIFVSPDYIFQVLRGEKNLDKEISYKMYSVADLVSLLLKNNTKENVVREVSHWTSSYYDKGQALWNMPWKNLGLFEAWKEISKHDKRHSLLGLGDIHSVLNSGPSDPKEFISYAIDRLGILEEYQEDYLKRLLVSIPGWSGYIQYKVRNKAMQGETDQSLVEFLAILIGYELAILNTFNGESWFSLYKKSGTKMEKSTYAPTELVVRYTLQKAYEITYRYNVYNKLQNSRAQWFFQKRNETLERPSLQAVFCIDVRSEVMRRHLEAISPDIETIGFAGFFGFPIGVQTANSDESIARCPVLLNPAYHIKEECKPEQKTKKQFKFYIENLKDLRIWNVFKSLPIATFSFVEALGSLYLFKLIHKTFGKKIDLNKNQDFLFPSITEKTENGIQIGIPFDGRIALAKGALKNMGLTENFAQVVLICGHGSETFNNPYGSGLDCGACGGHAGDSNARVAATILNDKQIREALKQDGIKIPEDTVFIAGLHNTTTDEFELYDTEYLNQEEQVKLKALKKTLQEASKNTRMERASKLGLKEKDIHKKIFQKAFDWSETRPEWGLAGNAAFIAAPRITTKFLNLEGRSFLHNYDYNHDKDGKILELIMTAPLVVGSWINLQYYASSVNNDYFGSGNKTIHNLVGKFAVIQGNSGDIRVGLPFQSVHDGNELVHKPIRLNAIIEAPLEMIEIVLKNHANVKQLFDNQWLNLTAIEPFSGKIFEYKGIENWTEIPNVDA